jgi:YfiH family protein
VSDLRAQLPGGGHVLFTDRSHGNMSSVGGDHAEHGERAREALRELLGARRLIRGYQVHDTHVQRISDPAHAVSEAAHADGQATSLPLNAAMVLSADCMPVALGAIGAIAMVHAGWRGLAAGVLEEGARAVRELGGGDRLAAVIGPCAGACCYEVGPEVQLALGEEGAARGHIDLRAIARRRLLAAGVTAIEDVSACTICDTRFFSHRREGARAGRQAGVAWLS